MEHNKNPFATAEAAWPSRDVTGSNLPGVASDEASDRLDFDPVALRARRDGWSPERQRAFIEELADCGVVREAAARVGMTEQAAYWLRRREDAASFNLAWEAALQLGGDRLRSLAYERAVQGTLKRHYYRGEVVGEERVYDNRLLIYLLGKAQPAANALDARSVVYNWDRWMQAIEDGLDKPMAAPDETLRAPAWQSDGGSWWTSFPPPEGFNGHQHGAPGDEDYRRQCTLDETASIEAARARAETEECRRRDLYFDRERLRFRPPR